MSKRPLFIAGNWKLNPPFAEGMALFRAISEGLEKRDLLSSGLSVVVFPPAPYLGLLSVGAAEKNSAAPKLGAQDLVPDDWGAFTGGLNASLLQQFGAQWVLVGHSERRHYYGETDDLCRQKVAAASAAGLCPLLCIGETEAERDAEETFAVLERQLAAGLQNLPRDADVVIAYEPVWAIGTGRTATPEIAEEAHQFVRQQLVRLVGERANKILILYGGSVKPDNAATLLAVDDIDGALIGGASLTSDSFLAIVDAGLVISL